MSSKALPEGFHVSFAESKVMWGWALGTVLALVIFCSALYLLLFINPRRLEAKVAEMSAAWRADQAATIQAAFVLTPTLAVETPVPTMAANLMALITPVSVEPVAALPATPEPTTTPVVIVQYVDRIIEVPVEILVTKEVPVIPLPTPTVPADSVYVCITTGEGVTGLYFNGEGIPAGCKLISAGVVSDYTLRVTGRNAGGSTSSGDSGRSGRDN